MSTRTKFSILTLATAGLIASVVATGAVGSLQGQAPPDFTTLASSSLAAQTAPHSDRAHNSMLAVPAGTYRLGRDDGPRVEQPAHTVELQAFRIDRTEVTNAAFAEYLNALNLLVEQPFRAGEASRRHIAGYHAPLLIEGREGSGLYPIIALDDAQVRIGFQNGAFAPTPGYENHPVAETTWAGARAYCIWRGAELPSEAQWEAAARGVDALLYPWGSAAPNPTRVFVSGRAGVTGPVGERAAGASPFGALDMSGSMAEWTASLMQPYPYDAGDGRERPDRAGERVTRGGDYLYDAEARSLTATHRDGFSNAPERGHRHIGFRCAANAA